MDQPPAIETTYGTEIRVNKYLDGVEFLKKKPQDGQKVSPCVAVEIAKDIISFYEENPFQGCSKSPEDCCVSGDEDDIEEDDDIVEDAEPAD